MVDLSKEFKSIQEKVDKLQEVADAQIAPPKKFENYTDYTDDKYRWTKFESRGWRCFNYRPEYFFWRSDGWGKKTTNREGLANALAHFDAARDRWIEDNAEIYERNQAIAAHNQLQFDRVAKIMETLGVKRVFSTWGYKTSRSRKMTETRSLAKWPDEVRDAVPVICGYDRILKTIQEKRDQVEKWGLAFIEKEEKRVRKEEEAKKEEIDTKKRIQTLAKLCTKYDLDLDSEPHDILMKIISEDKYLYLAHYTEANRIDWNGGYALAETGLAGFDVESEEDQDIYDCIQGIIDEQSEGCVDGRAFRDCRWDYGVLFGMVKSEPLMTDYQEIKQYLD